MQKTFTNRTRTHTYTYAFDLILFDWWYTHTHIIRYINRVKVARIWVDEPSRQYFYYFTFDKMKKSTLFIYPSSERLQRIVHSKCTECVRYAWWKYKFIIEPYLCTYLQYLGNFPSGSNYNRDRRTRMFGKLIILGGGGFGWVGWRGAVDIVRNNEEFRTNWTRFEYG